jgi:DNA repair exonuclease SbcCD ATPase subunit
MSDSNFINAYNEVILENLNAIMKQNFMFQTQIKFLEERVNKIPEMEEKLTNVENEKSAKQNDYNSLVDERNRLSNEVGSLRNELDDKNRIIQNNVTSDNDKHRLQTAVNQQAGEIDRLKNTIESMEKEIDSHKKYNSQLEEMLPNSKKKKLGIEIPEEDTPKVEVKKEETAPIINATPLTFESAGGTF